MILFSDVYFIKIKQNQIKQIYQIQNLINLQKFILITLLKKNIKSLSF